MSTYFFGLPLLAVAAVLQATVLARLRLAGGNLDLVLLLALSWTLIGEWQGGPMWGLMGGLLLDLLSGGPFGASAVALVIVTYLASLTEGRFYRSHFLLPLATVLLGTVLYYVIYLALLQGTGHTVTWLASLRQVALPAVLLNTLFMLPVYHALRWVHALLHPAPVTM